jgi:hypothetical protein
MLINDLNELPKCFKEGIRVILLIHRNKDGNKGNAQRKSIKKISMNIEEYENIVFKFDYLRKHNPDYKDYRIYASLNSRNIEKAIHKVKLLSVENDYAREEEKLRFYTERENIFFSCLMNSDCKVDSNVLIDCDSKEEYLEALQFLPVKIILFKYETKNGHHIITKPFNPKLYPILEIKKDPLIYLG